MSTETFLTGSVSLKPGVTEAVARQLVKDIGEYTEVNEAQEGIVNFDYYQKYLFGKVNGKAVLVLDRFDGKEYIDIRYHDVSWNSHIHGDKWDDLEETLKRKRDILREVSLGLYYLTEPDANIYYEQSAKPGETGSWDGGNGE